MQNHRIGIDINADVKGTVEVKKLKGVIDETAVGTEKFGARLDSLTGRLKAVAAAAAAYLGFSGFASAVKGASDLEAKLSEVQAVANATAGEMNAIRAAAESAGAATQYTATEAAGAMGELARSGLDANAAIAALKPTLELASAGGIGLEQAASVVTKALAGFSLQATDASRVADVLAKGANASNTSVKGLAEALSYAAPTANAANLSLEATVALLGKFADGGIDASRGGTALNAILSQFLDTGSKFRAELSNAGITTGNFERMLLQLAEAGAKGEKAILAVGTEAGPALRSLLNQGIPALEKLRTELQGAAGSAAATAKVMQDNLQGSVNGLSSAWDTLKNKLATPILPVLRDGVDRLSAAFKSAVDGGQVEAFGNAVAKGFQAAMEWFSRFMSQVNFTQLGQDIGTAIGHMGDAFESIRQSADNAGNAFKVIFGTLSAGFNGLLAPIFKLGEAFATVSQGILSGVAVINEKLAAITFGKVSERFAEAARQIRTEAGAAGAVAEAMGGKANQAFIAMADGAALARAGFTRLGAESGPTAQGVDGVAKAARGAATDLEKMGQAAGQAAQKAAEASQRQTQAAEQSKKAVADLRAEYQAAMDSGNWQAAADAAQRLAVAINKAKTASGAMSESAKDQAKAVEAAFVGMGIATKQQLTDAAQTAVTRFQLIKDSGQATSEGLRTAWQKMAEAVIAANGGVATDVLKAQAGMYQLKVTTDEFGRSVISAMDGGSNATDRFSASVRGATQSLVEQNAALEQQISAQEKANELKDRAIALENKRKNVDREGFSLNTNGQRINQAVPDATYIRNAAKSAGLSDAETARIMRDFLSNGQPVAPGGYNDGRNMDWFSRVNEAINNRLNSAVTSGGAAGRQTAAAGTTTARTYDVKFNGRTVRTASDADAKALMDMLQQARKSA